ncbi:MAG: AI-2E family transporter [Alphaproteobacteria bacterium]
MKTSTRVLWFVAFALVFLILIYGLKGMLLPFVLSTILAYLLNPVVSVMENKRVPRWLGTVVAVVGTLTVMVVFLGSIVPVLSVQGATLVHKLSELDYSLESTILSVKTWLETTMGLHWDGSVQALSPEGLKTWVTSKGDEALAFAGNVAHGVLLRGFVLVDVLSIMVLTPILTFYMLRDWPVFVANIESLYPMDMKSELLSLQRRINGALSGFIRGQTLVCVSLGSFYALFLSVAGLDFGLVIGFFSGMVSFIPYVGTLLGGILSLGVALLQFGFDDMGRVGTVALIFLIGQFIEGNILSPKLVGDRVNLHPVWIIFALFAGGSLAGFLGVLVAVPTAAVLGVLVRFGLEKYRASTLYQKNPF